MRRSFIEYKVCNAELKVLFAHAPDSYGRRLDWLRGKGLWLKNFWHQSALPEFFVQQQQLAKARLAALSAHR